MAPLSSSSAHGASDEGRAEVELVVRSIAQLGNYDYLIDWIFTQSRRHSASRSALTGSTAPKAARSQACRPARGSDDATLRRTRSRPIGWRRPIHSHHFNFRLDLDIDGRQNSFGLGELKVIKAQGSPRKSVWVHDEKVLQKENRVSSTKERFGAFSIRIRRMRAVTLSATCWKITRTASRYWTRRITSAPALSAMTFGSQPIILSNDTLRETLLIKTREPLGLPQYVKNDESIEKADIVLWHTLSSTMFPWRRITLFCRARSSPLS